MCVGFSHVHQIYDWSAVQRAHDWLERAISFRNNDELGMRQQFLGRRHKQIRNDTQSGPI